MAWSYFASPSTFYRLAGKMAPFFYVLAVLFAAAGLYFAFLVAFALVPACSVYRAVRDRINWRAFSFAMLVMFTVSTWWEATVAFPYQWWTYRDEMMIGVFIKAWNGLPVEEPLLWLLVSFTTVLTFEANLLDLLGKRSAAELRFVASAHPRPGPML